jgi:hypothetical protein
MKLEFSLQIFDKYSNLKISKNPSSRNLIFPCGRTDVEKDGGTDRYDEFNSRFSKICERAEERKFLPVSDMKA